MRSARRVSGTCILRRGVRPVAALPSLSVGVTFVHAHGNHTGMNTAYDVLPGRPGSGLLVVVDHASRAVPADIDLGIGEDLVSRHIGWDIGAAALAQALCVRLACPGLFGTVSRLVIDLHREEDSPGLIPMESDGHPIPGNRRLGEKGRADRIARYWKPYHARLADLVRQERPTMIVAVHSFTPRLEAMAGPDRPWQVGILYNRDDRAARIAIPALRAKGFETGDNQPYSGQVLNATMNMHAEAVGLPYLAIEVRNDLLANAEGIARWVEILEPVIVECRNKLAQAATDRP